MITYRGSTSRIRSAGMNNKKCPCDNEQTHFWVVVVKEKKHHSVCYSGQMPHVVGMRNP